MSKSTFFGSTDDLSHAPEAVKQVRLTGCVGISYFPDGFTSIDTCGCCSTDHKPGWYERIIHHKGQKPEHGSLKFICGLDIEPTTNSKCGGGSILDCNHQNLRE